MNQLINAKDIDIQTKIISKQISDKHIDDKTPVVMVGLLNGCFAFYADLVRAMPINVECDFMRVKSYINRKQGDIVISKDLETPIKGKHVYIVDDIYDTGNTMKVVIDYLKVKKPSSISIVSLVTRRTSPKPKVPFFNAFEIGDEWLVGFGMDNDKGYYRNLPAIYYI
jgi:hypoxanthine phosphoribosyltransferase